MTDSQPDSDSPSPKPRGLWSLMGAPAEPVADPTEPALPADTEAEIPAQEPPPAEISEIPEAPSPKQRGLWGIMGKASAESFAPPKPDPQPVAEPQAPEIESWSDGPPARRRLFDVMPRAADQTSGEAGTRVNRVSISGMFHDDATAEEQDEEEIEMELVNPPDEESEEVEEVEPIPDVVLTRPEPMEIINLDELEAPRHRLIESQAIKQVQISAACGIAALAASCLSLLPSVFAGLPAPALGFAAIIAGFLVLTGPGRRHLSSRSRALSIVGMLCGTVGIFLGPLLISGLGRSLREPKGEELTRTHLKEISDGLELHYKQHDAYPIGGTFSRNEAGVIRGQHGWMTFLLPFVKEAELYQRIDQSKPFDDPVNRNSMGTNVGIYFAAGGDRSRNGDGFAIAHFAGVGGEINEADRLAHLGIFERDAAVKRNEVTDGLSNTLIIGELAGTYPPWGDPENWRKIGPGLNKDKDGFGSQSGQGSMFLLGDGTVKLFPNKTDPKLLEKLSTRDGAEK
jgi:hypothetical protein